MYVRSRSHGHLPSVDDESSGSMIIIGCSFSVVDFGAPASMQLESTQLVLKRGLTRQLFHHPVIDVFVVVDVIIAEKKTL